MHTRSWRGMRIAFPSRRRRRRRAPCAPQVGILHGDPFLDNILCDGATGAVSGFVDLEDVTLGPCLFDAAARRRPIRTRRHIRPRVTRFTHARCVAAPRASPQCCACACCFDAETNRLDCT
eukprot:6240130-Prymnesium_polylepis.1